MGTRKLRNQNYHTTKTVPDGVTTLNASTVAGCMVFGVPDTEMGKSPVRINAPDTNYSRAQHVRMLYSRVPD